MTNTGMPGVDITDEDKLWSVLSWVFPIPVAGIALLLDDVKDRPFIRWNAIQALAVGCVSLVQSMILGWVFGIGCVISLAIFAYSVYLGFKAYSENWVEVPFVTEFCKKQGWLS